MFFTCKASSQSFCTGVSSQDLHPVADSEETQEDVEDSIMLRIASIGSSIFSALLYLPLSVLPNDRYSCCSVSRPSIPQESFFEGSNKYQASLCVVKGSVRVEIKQGVKMIYLHGGEPQPSSNELLDVSNRVFAVDESMIRDLLRLQVFINHKPLSKANENGEVLGERDFTKKAIESMRWYRLAGQKIGES